MLVDRGVLCGYMCVCRYLAVCVDTDLPSTPCQQWLDANTPHTRSQAARTSSAGGGPSTGFSQPTTPALPPHRTSDGYLPEFMDRWTAVMRPQPPQPAAPPPPPPEPAAGGFWNWQHFLPHTPGPYMSPHGPIGTPSQRMGTYLPPHLRGMGHEGAYMQGVGGPAQQGYAGLDRAGEPKAPRIPFYELRIYSLDGPTFGQIVAARPIRAAQCLTSIQFSPTSQHLLVAYGRRHINLCSLLQHEGHLTPVHTALEVFR